MDGKVMFAAAKKGKALKHQYCLSIPHVHSIAKNDVNLITEHDIFTYSFLIPI